MKVVVEVTEKSCEAVNKAIRNLPPSGGTIVLAEGTYLCGNPLVIDRDNVTIRGAGSGRTILRAKDATPLPVVVIGSIKNTDVNQDGVPYPDHVTRNVSLSGLTADGNYHSHPHPGEVECWDPKTAKSKSCDGDAVSIRNNGLTIRRAGIYINSSCQGFVVDGVKITHSSGRCTRFTQLARVKVAGGTTCNDGNAVKVIDGDYIGTDFRP